MKKILTLTLSILFLLSGCATNTKKSTDKISIVTTIFPVYDFVRAVADDKADIKLLIDPGTEVHAFDPIPSDIMAIKNSDCFFYIGGESDVWVNTVIDDVSHPVTLMKCVDTIEEEDGHHHDEHIWTSPYNAQKMVSEIAKILAEIDANNADIYLENAKKYNNEIQAVAERIQKVVNTAENPFMLIADRNPYVYFANAFGIEYKAAFGGCANSTDISIKTMSALIDTVKSRKLKCAFYTEMSSRNIAKTLKEETGINIYQLNSAHNVTKEEFEKGVTYVDLMKANADALEKGWN